MSLYKLIMRSLISGALLIMLTDCGKKKGASPPAQSIPKVPKAEDSLVPQSPQGKLTVLQDKQIEPRPVQQNSVRQTPALRNAARQEALEQFRQTVPAPTGR